MKEKLISVMQNQRRQIEKFLKWLSAVIPAIWLFYLFFGIFQQMPVEKLIPVSLLATALFLTVGFTVLAVALLVTVVAQLLFYSFHRPNMTGNITDSRHDRRLYLVKKTQADAGKRKE